MGDVTLRYLLFGEDRSASKTVKGVGEAAESTATKLSGVVSRLGGALGGDMGQLLDRASQAIGLADGKTEKLGARMLATGTVATGAGLAMQQMASGDVEAQNRLSSAIEATGQSTDDYSDRVDGLVESQVRFGHQDGDVKNALAKLVDAYHDPTQALDRMQLATDLAAAKHVSLGEAAGIVAKAHGGAGKVFKEFGQAVGENADGSKDYEGALDQLAGQLSGRASASQDSFAGKVREGRAWLGNAASAFAEQYGPAITTAGVALTGLGAALEIAKAAQISHVATTVAAKAAQLGTAVATGVATAAQWAWNAALSANPIGLIVIAIAALVGAILYAWNNFDWFRNGVTAVWEAIKTGFSWMWDNVLKPGFEGFQAALRVVGNAGIWLWNNALQPAFSFIVGGIAWLLNTWAGMLRGLSNVPGFGWAADAATAMQGAADKATALQQGIKKIDEIPDPSVTVRFDAYLTPAYIQAMQTTSANKRAAILDVGANASGTLSWRGGLTWVGERGPELLELPAGTRIYDNASSMAIARGSSIQSIATGGLSGPVVVHVVDADGVMQGMMRGVARQESAEQANSVLAGVW